MLTDGYSESRIYSSDKSIAVAIHQINIYSSSSDTKRSAATIFSDSSLSDICCKSINDAKRIYHRFITVNQSSDCTESSANDFSQQPSDNLSRETISLDNKKQIKRRCNHLASDKALPVNQTIR